MIAGHRAGLKTIIIPKENKKDLEDIPENVKKDIKFVFVEKVDEVLGTALKLWPPKLKKIQKSLPISSYLAAN